MVHIVKFNPIQNGVYILVEVSFDISSHYRENNLLFVVVSEINYINMLKVCTPILEIYIYIYKCIDDSICDN